MTRRLQVLFDDDELAEIQELARRRRQTTAAWVRDALRRARESSAYPEAGPKLLAIREAARHAYPAGGIDEMLAEVERGYGGAESAGGDGGRGGGGDSAASRR